MSPRGRRNLNDVGDDDVTGLNKAETAPIPFVGSLAIITMFHQRTPSAESTCEVLTCTLDEFWDLFDKANLATNTPTADVLAKVMKQNRERLPAANSLYRLDDLLSATLHHAPHPLGQRYVVVALHIANRKGVVIAIAESWMKQMFLPSQFLSLSLGIH